MTNLSCKIYFLYVVTICLYFHDYHENKVAFPKKIEMFMYWKFANK